MNPATAFRHDLMAALAERLTPRPPDVPVLTTPPPPRKRTARSLVKSALRPWVVRYIQPRVVQEVSVAAARLRLEILEEIAEDAARLESIEVNAEVLKAQLHSVANTLERLTGSFDAMAMAIAPTAGIEGVPDRLAEFRERLNAVERRTRTGVRAVEEGNAAAATEATDSTNGPRSHRSPIDYVGFERRFRGAPNDVQQVVQERYLELLRGHAPVLDVGCGKGELVEALVAAAVTAVGIDLDPGMVAEAQAKGLDVRVADVNDFLDRQASGSLGAIVSTQVVEHMQMEELVRFLELSASRLQPGGVFVAETPNPASLIVLGTHFILDPTHIRPIHPALMVYLCECAGFRSVELRYYAPASHYHLAMLDDDGADPWVARVNANFTRINDVVFGPQDYAVVARTPPQPVGSP